LVQQNQGCLILEDRQTKTAEGSPLGRHRLPGVKYRQTPRRKDFHHEERGLILFLQLPDRFLIANHAAFGRTVDGIVHGFSGLGVDVGEGVGCCSGDFIAFFSEEPKRKEVDIFSMIGRSSSKRVAPVTPKISKVPSSPE